MGLLFPVSNKGCFILYMHHLTEWIAHTTDFDTPAEEHWVHRVGSDRRPIQGIFSILINCYNINCAGTMGIRL